MPILTLQCAKHPNKEQTERLIERLTSVIVEELGVPKEVTHVLISNINPQLWGVGGISLSKKFEELHKEE